MRRTRNTLAALLDRGAGVPGRGLGARARPARQPADPRVAVRLGRRDRPDRLLRRPRGAVAQAAPRGRPAGARCPAAGAPRLARGRDRLRRDRRRAPRRSCSWAGFAGRQGPQDNLAPTFIFIIFWVGLVFAIALFGDVFRAFNPWRALGRVLAPVLPAARGRTRSASAAGRPRSASRLHLDRARLGLGRAARSASAIAASVYVVGDADRAGALRRRHVGAPRRRLRGVLQPVRPDLGLRDARPRRRRPPVPRRPAGAGSAPGTVAFISVMIGTVTFDGLSQGKLWKDFAAELNDLFASGRELRDRAQAPATVGLLLGVGLVAGFYVLGIKGARSVGGDLGEERLRDGFVHSLVPIAMVYVAAHYLTFLLFEGQASATSPRTRSAAAGTCSAPRPRASTTASSARTNLVRAGGLRRAGHVAALVLAHDRALALYGQAQAGGAVPVLDAGVMVGFTTLALWLLAQAGTT